MISANLYVENERERERQEVVGSLKTVKHGTRYRVVGLSSQAGGGSFSEEATSELGSE